MEDEHLHTCTTCKQTKDAEQSEHVEHFEISDQSEQSSIDTWRMSEQMECELSNQTKISKYVGEIS